MEKRSESGKKKKTEYTNQYIKENLKAYVFKFSRITEQELIDQIDRQPNKQGYIKRLIIEDIKKGD